MGYEEWTENVEEVVGIDKNGNPVTITTEKKYYKIICDNCGKLIVDTSNPNLTSGSYNTVGTGDNKKYYCTNCYEILKAKGEI